MCQLDRIMAKRDIIHELAKKHKVDKVFVFGSCARKEETPESDIDFLMDFDFDSSWKDHLTIQDELEKLFNCEIDIVSKRWLHPLLKEQVLEEAIEI